MIHYRKILMAAVFALAPLTSAEAADTTLRMATQVPNDSVEGRVHTRFAELAGQYTDGRVEVLIFPNNQIGNLESALEQVSLGSIQIVAEGLVRAKKWEDKLNWLAAPFLFEDREHWVRFIESPVVQGWLQTVADEGGVIVLGNGTEIERGPFRVIVSKRPIATVDDLQGLGMRLFSNKTQIEAWSYFGASPKVLSWTEVYQSLQTGLVEATTSPLSLVESMRFYEQAKNITRTDEYFQSVSYLLNKGAWDAMSEEDRAGVTKAYSEAGEYSSELLAVQAKTMIGSLEGQGVSYLEPDMQPFVDKLSGYYSDLAAKNELPEGMMETLEATAGSAK